MRPALIFYVLSCLLIARTSVRALGDDSLEKAKSQLLEKGIRVTHTELSLSSEADFNKSFGEAAALKRKLMSASKALNEAERVVEGIDDEMRERMKYTVELNTQLANVARANVVVHNQLVGATNANNGAIKLLLQDEEAAKKEVDKARKTTNTARENYVEHIMQIRKSADEISKQYAALATDAEAQAALDAWNAAAKSSLTIKRSRMFQSSLKRLGTLEKSVITEKISLRREGNSFFATVVINGNHTHDMVVDTGAALVALPYKEAAEFGVHVDESLPTAIASIADGSKVKSKIATLDTVRVGQFTARNVQCLILPKSARNAPSLLGMSFLGQFDFAINGTELVLSRVDSEHASAKPKKTRPSKTSKKSSTRPKLESAE
jgi:clan AA aspartic protease (TIGR02281 family)